MGTWQISDQSRDLRPGLGCHLNDFTTKAPNTLPQKSTMADQLFDRYRSNIRSCNWFRKWSTLTLSVAQNLYRQLWGMGHFRDHTATIGSSDVTNIIVIPCKNLSTTVGKSDPESLSCFPSDGNSGSTQIFWRSPKHTWILAKEP